MTSEPHIRRFRGPRSPDPIAVQKAKTDFDIACADLAMAAAQLQRAQKAAVRARQHWIDVRDCGDG